MVKGIQFKSIRASIQSEGTRAKSEHEKNVAQNFSRKVLQSGGLNCKNYIEHFGAKINFCSDFTRDYIYCASFGTTKNWPLLIIYVDILVNFLNILSKTISQQIEIIFAFIGFRKLRIFVDQNPNSPTYGRWEAMVCMSLIRKNP